MSRILALVRTASHPTTSSGERDNALAALRRLDDRGELERAVRFTSPPSYQPSSYAEVARLREENAELTGKVEQLEREITRLKKPSKPTLPSGFCSIDHVLSFTGKSKSTVYRWIRDHDFPPSINGVEWESADVERWWKLNKNRVNKFKRWEGK